MPEIIDLSQKSYGVRSLLGHLITTETINYLHPVCLGSGAYGAVYHVDLIHDSLNKLTSLGKPLEWVYKRSKSYFTEESKIQSRFYVTLKPIKGKDGYYYTFTEYLPGVDLKFYQSQNFTETMQILCQLASQVSDFHHFTRRGAPFIHGDIKDGNIKVDIDKTTHRINTYIYDFGFSSTQNTDNSNQLFKLKQVNPANLNRDYFPKEALSGKYGFKTDVYMFGAIMQRFLRTIPKALGGQVKTTIETFISRVRSEEYSKRPTSDEVLKFCLILNGLHLLSQKQIADKQLQTALLAKFFVLAADCWNQPMTSKVTWSYFDYEDNPAICEAICLLNQKSLIKDSALTLLVVHPDVPIVINHLNKLGCLNEYTLKLLCDNPTLVTQLKSASRLDALTILTERSSALNQKELERFFVMNEVYPDVVNQLIRQEVKRLTLPILNQGLDIMIQTKKTISLDILQQLQGSLNDKRATAKKIINYHLANCQNQEEVMQLLESLKQINYLFKRQGFFTFSIFNHKYQGQKVSRTWLDIVNLHERRIQDLTCNPIKQTL